MIRTVATLLAACIVLPAQAEVGTGAAPMPDGDAFVMMDVNRDGRLERREVMDAVANARMEARPRILSLARTLAAFDRDGNGVVEGDERPELPAGEVRSDRPSKPVLPVPPSVVAPSVAVAGSRAEMAEAAGMALSNPGFGQRREPPKATAGVALVWAEKHLSREGMWNERPSSIQVRGTPPGHPSKPAEFVVENLGDAHSGPFEVLMDGTMGVVPSEWSVDRDSPCLVTGAPPSGSCVVKVRLSPIADAQTMAVFRLPGGFDRNDRTKNMVVTAYARNVAGVLPAGVIGNGDRCPAAGSPAEVVVSDTGHRAPGGSYFAGKDHYEPFYASPSKTLATAGCLAWRKGSDGVLGCDNQGAGHHSSTLRIYAGPTIEGPWSVQDEKPGYISARLICVDGLIDQVAWTW